MSDTTTSVWMVYMETWPDESGPLALFHSFEGAKSFVEEHYGPVKVSKHRMFHPEGNYSLHDYEARVDGIIYRIESWDVDP